MLYSHKNDVYWELLELGRELTNRVRQEFSYYQASVYKHEAAKKIEKKIEKLELICSLLASHALVEIFQDFRATNGMDLGKTSPQISHYTLHVSSLLNSLERFFRKAIENHSFKQNFCLPDSFERRVKSQQDQILSLCWPGSRQWQFFYKFSGRLSLF